MTVLGELEKAGAETVVLDLSLFPERLRLEIQYNGTHHDAVMTLTDNTRVPLSDCGAVWWRRPQPFRIPLEVQQLNHRSFAYNEAMETFAGLWQVLDAFWVNHPTRDDVAHRKVFQLRT